MGSPLFQPIHLHSWRAGPTGAEARELLLAGMLGGVAVLDAETGEQARGPHQAGTRPATGRVRDVYGRVRLLLTSAARARAAGALPPADCADGRRQRGRGERRERRVCAPPRPAPPRPWIPLLKPLEPCMGALHRREGESLSVRAGPSVTFLVRDVYGARPGCVRARPAATDKCPRRGAGVRALLFDREASGEVLRAAPSTLPCPQRARNAPATRPPRNPDERYFKCCFPRGSLPMSAKYST